MSARERKLEVALANLLRCAERQTCMHEETKRGGTNWTICCACGAKWADDEGGFRPYKPPPEFLAAQRLLRPRRPTQEP